MELTAYSQRTVLQSQFDSWVEIVQSFGVPVNLADGVILSSGRKVLGVLQYDAHTVSEEGLITVSGERILIDQTIQPHVKIDTLLHELSHLLLLKHLPPEVFGQRSPDEHEFQACFVVCQAVEHLAPVCLRHSYSRLKEMSFFVQRDSGLEKRIGLEQECFPVVCQIVEMLGW